MKTILKFIFICIFSLIFYKSDASDTIRVYVIGAGYYNRLYIKNGNTDQKINVNGYNSKAVRIIVPDTLNLTDIKFLYKYGIFGKRKNLSIPPRNGIYLQIDFHVLDGEKRCLARWRDTEIRHG
jgi:hypothetical protein